MIEETARVTRVIGDQIDIESVVKSGCSGCKQLDTCGSGQIAKGLGVRRLKLTLTSSLELQQGDEVVIGLPENNLLGAALQVYLLPLVGLLVAGALGQLLLVQQWQQHELLALCLTVLGGFAGFAVARYKQLQPESQKALQARILRKCDKSDGHRAIPVNIRN